MSLRTLALLATLMFTCCACSGPVRSGTVRSGTLATANQPFTLRPGEQAALPQQASLRYVGVDNDSRCPPTVTCVWAGDAQVKLVFEQAGKAVDVVLHSADPTPQPLQQWTLTLVALERGAAPAATLRLDEAPR